MIFAEIESKINTKNGNEILLLKREPESKNYDKTILVIGVFHGDEKDGEYLINRYLSQKKRNKKQIAFYSLSES